MCEYRDLRFSRENCIEWIVRIIPVKYSILCEIFSWEVSLFAGSVIINFLRNDRPLKFKGNKKFYAYT